MRHALFKVWLVHNNGLSLQTFIICTNQLTFFVINRTYGHTCRINIAYGIITTTCIHPYRIILLRQRVNSRKPSQYRIIMPCSIVIPIQSFLRVIFLAVILIRLDIRSTCKYPSEGIVMVRFLYSAWLVDNYPVVPLMVFQIVVILLSSGQVDIALFGKKHLLHSVFIDHISAVIGSGGSAAYLMDCS